jgi:Na+/phosphate symporter
MKMHSIIDVITNSSTEIYTFTSEESIKDAYNLLNEIIKISGSDKKAEDLFIITREYDDLCKIADIINDNIEKVEEQELKDLLSKEEAYYENEELMKYLKENLEICNKYISKFSDCDDNFESKLLILAKDKNISDKDIYKMFFGLFGQSISYNG